MDRITSSLLENFQNTQEISEMKECDAFEHFCNFSVISNQYSKTFAVNEISTGDGTGIDGIGIIINGHLIENEEEINDLLRENDYIEATFIFIQAKTSSNFSGNDILLFFKGISDFFAVSPSLPRNEELSKFAEWTNVILNYAPKFRRNPDLKVFYITTGNLQEDAFLSGIIESQEREWNNLSLFENIEIKLLGANEIGKLYRKSLSPNTSSFNFSEKVTLPKIGGVEQAYFGVLPFIEFKKILIDENDNLLNVFDDNVRDFQGENPVNNEISKTLTEGTPELFSVLNNGITIVADAIKSSANLITITDYQIVNGCQTSNVLFENRHVDGINEINIPIRLIVTNQDDVKSSITISTNHQIAIRKEQLSVMSEFHKNLEEYYKSRKLEMDLYYERRTKQYASDPNVVKRRIITVSNQVKSFSALFNQDPHLVTTYFGRLAERMHQENSNLCDVNHQFAPYYMAGLAYYKLDTLFLNKDIDKKYKKVRFYLLMLSLMISTIQPTPLMNSLRKTEAFCEPIIKKLLDEKKCSRIFSKAAEIIDRSGAAIEDKQSLKSRAMTQQIIDAFEENDRI